MEFSNCLSEKPLLEALKKLHWHELTPVQEQVMPLWLETKNVLVQAKTGSGKTGAYLLPVLERIRWENNAPQCLILTPTRELAKQVKADVEALGKYKRIKCVALIGKEPMAFQIQDLRQKCHVVVGTCGRIWEHLQQGNMPLTALHDVIVDEADEMCRMGFLKTLTKILEQLPQPFSMCLCSATLDDKVAQLCDRYAFPYERIIVDETLWKAQIQSYAYYIQEAEKSEFIWKLLLQRADAATIIFCNTRDGCEQLYHNLKPRIPALSLLHGAMDQQERERELEHFRSGRSQVLIASDIAARGLDLDLVNTIVNYDLPVEKERFIHRAGRSARYQNEGQVISFITSANLERKKELEEYCGCKMIMADADLIRAQVDDEDARQHLYDQRCVHSEKSTVFHDDILKLYIYGGKKQKMRAKDIVGALCQIDGMTFDDIGVIQIQDWGSYVEILHGKGYEAMEKLNQTTIKNQHWKVEISNKQ